MQGVKVALGIDGHLDGAVEARWCKQDPGAARQVIDEAVAIVVFVVAAFGLCDDIALAATPTAIWQTSLGSDLTGPLTNPLTAGSKATHISGEARLCLIFLTRTATLFIGLSIAVIVEAITALCGGVARFCIAFQAASVAGTEAFAGAFAASLSAKAGEPFAHEVFVNAPVAVVIFVIAELFLGEDGA